MTMAVSMAMAITIACNYATILTCFESVATLWICGCVLTLSYLQVSGSGSSSEDDKLHGANNGSSSMGGMKCLSLA